MKIFFNRIFMAVFFILALCSLGLADEKITITTYYPSPYGSYQDLRADQMAIGSAYRQSTIASGTSLIVEGSVGIGTPTPDGSYKLDVIGLVNATGYYVGGIPGATGTATYIKTVTCNCSAAVGSCTCTTDTTIGTIAVNNGIVTTIN